MWLAAKLHFGQILEHTYVLVRSRVRIDEYYTFSGIIKPNDSASHKPRVPISIANLPLRKSLPIHYVSPKFRPLSNEKTLSFAIHHYRDFRP